MRKCFMLYSRELIFHTAELFFSEMKLIDAFQIQNKEVVAFVGGGGKTTTMFRLADELVAQGKRVVTTTTTRIFAAQIQLAPKSLRLETRDWRQEIERIRRELQSSPHLLIVGMTSDDGKAFGVEPTLMDELIGLDEVDVVLIEADGSRMRAFKAPAEHEPVIPASTTLLVPIVGMDVLGKTLTDENVHRAEIVSRVAEIPLGAILQNEHIARVLGDARGGLKNKPKNARVIPFLNKVENAEQAENARTIATKLLQNDAIESVAIGAVKNLESRISNLQSPVSSLQSRVSAVILAAGGSTRMRGETKQLLKWGDTTVVGNAARVVGQARVNEMIVVTGNHADQVRAEILGTNACVVYNPAWTSGRASSIRMGIGEVHANSYAAIFINADQPFLTARVIDSILEKFFETRAPIVVPTYDGKTGSPVLFARELFDELCALQGEQGGRDLLQKYRDVLVSVEIEDPRAAMDLNTPEQYAAAKRIKDEG
ncbi:MAG: putative selenium-dependent hydroxylase accessory protein YqeC [Chloroflexota bacterium]|nr:MAG: putative selenium-dependent hydroxylase accessory protein YqeC [Chloroflexota bacterium]